MVGQHIFGSSTLAPSDECGGFCTPCTVITAWFVPRVHSARNPLKHTMYAPGIGATLAPLWQAVKRHHSGVDTPVLATRCHVCTTGIVGPGATLTSIDMRCANDQ